MTVCVNCETAEGPFTRKAKLGPLCVPTPPAVMAEFFTGKKDPRLVACNKRRTALDDERHGKEVSA